jgi:hypothetical protein
MLELKSFKNKHKGEDIYVFGSGPTCNYIPSSFVEGKITVGTNQTWRKYNTNYVVRKEHNLLQKTLDGYNNVVLISEWDCGNQHGGCKIDATKYNKANNLCVYNHLHNDCSSINMSCFDKESFLCVSWSTITTSMHFAFYLGAKNIFLVGVDHGTLDGLSTFKGYYEDTSEISGKSFEQYNNWLTKIDAQTIVVRDKLVSLGTNVYSINPFTSLRLEGHSYK